MYTLTPDVCTNSTVRAQQIRPFGSTPRQSACAPSPVWSGFAAQAYANRYLAVLPTRYAEIPGHMHLFLLGDLQALARKTDLVTARSKWSTCIWIYLQNEDCDLDTATSFSE